MGADPCCGCDSAAFEGASASVIVIVIVIVIGGGVGGGRGRVRDFWIEIVGAAGHPLGWTS
jgi:hypothetical protein